MKSYRVAYVWHIPLCRMSYVIHIPSCRYKYVIDICPYVSEEMDLAHICKSTDLNMQIYRMEYANLQDWICTSTQSNMTFYRVAYVWHIPLCRMSYVIHIPSCRGWIASVAQALSSQCLDEGPSPLHWPSWCTVRRCSFYFRPRQHVDCLTSALLLMHFAPTECSSGSIQQFIRRHPPLSSFFLVPLKTFCFASLAPWKERESELTQKALWALPRSYSLCWQGWGCSRSGSTLSMLPGWQPNFHHSSQICSSTGSGLWIWLCW